MSEEKDSAANQETTEEQKAKASKQEQQASKAQKKTEEEVSKQDAQQPEAEPAEAVSEPPAAEAQPEPAAEAQEPLLIEVEAEALEPFGSEYRPLAEAFEKTRGLLAEAVGVILDKPVTLSRPRLGLLPGESGLSGARAGTVAIKAEFTAGVEGQMAFLTQTTAASALVKIILGSETEQQEKLSAEEMDAFLELVNQLIGKLVLSLSEWAATTISVGPAAAMDQDEAAKFGTDGKLVAAQFDLVVPQLLQTPFMFVLTSSVADQLLVCSKGPSLEEVMEKSAEAQPQMAPTAEPSVSSQLDERLEMVMDMELPIYVRFGETQMRIKDVLQLGPGSIIELNKPVDSPVELVINDKMVIAKGEVVVVDSNFAVRITEVKSKSDRIKGLG